LVTEILRRGSCVRLEELAEVVSASARARDTLFVSSHFRRLPLNTLAAPLLLAARFCLALADRARGRGYNSAGIEATSRLANPNSLAAVRLHHNVRYSQGFDKKSIPNHSSQ